MFTWKIFEGPKLLYTVMADTSEDAMNLGRRMSDRPKRLRVVFVGVTPATVWAPFLNDIPEEIWEEASA